MLKYKITHWINKWGILLIPIIFIIVLLIIPNKSNNKEIKNISKKIDILIKQYDIPKKEIINKAILKSKIRDFIKSKQVWENGKLVTFDTQYAKSLANSIVDNTDYPVIITAICYVESKFSLVDKSKKGAIGLGQINPIHIDELKKAKIIHNDIKELYGMVCNLRAVNFVLKQKLDKTNGNINEALVLYSGKANKYKEKISNIYLELSWFLFNSI